MTEARSPAVLLLEDGRAFEGRAYGARGQTLGEAVFCTGMTGYQETLTDPSYHRQVVIMTAPHIGNTGMNKEDPESDRIWVAGLVVREPARVRSSWRSSHTLEEMLTRQGVIGISDLDTRALTRHLREQGAMRVGIFSTDHTTTDRAELLDRVRTAPEMLGAALSTEVSTRSSYRVPAIGTRRFTIAAIDYGIKAMTLRRLAERGVQTQVLPADTSWPELRSMAPDGLFLSNGPGDPASSDLGLIEAALQHRLPVFGICLGHELLGRALGFRTYKLKYGHHGINQPVQDRRTGKVDITAHNHGFALEMPLAEATETRFGRVQASHVCLNDNVVEGLELLDRPAFSVQYHPEAGAGPHDAAYLFDRFISLLEDRRAQAL